MPERRQRPLAYMFTGMTDRSRLATRVTGDVQTAVRAALREVRGL